MSQLMWQLASMLLSLLSLPLLSIGTDTATPLVWVPGLALVGVAGAIPPVLRYVTPGGSEPEGDDNDAGTDNGGGDIS